MPSRYWYVNRPGGIGCQPDGSVNRNTFCPSKETPEYYGMRTYGWVEYAEPLTPYDAWRFDLVPVDVSEQLYRMCWLHSNKNDAEAKWLMEDYMSATDETLKMCNDGMADLVQRMRAASGTKVTATSRE